MQWYVIVDGLTGRMQGAVLANSTKHAKATATRLLGYASYRYTWLKDEVMVGHS